MASEQLLSLSENDFEVIQSGVDSTHRSIDPPLSDSFVIPPMFLSTTTLTDEKSIKNDESTITSDQQETGLLNSSIISIASSNSSDAMTSMLRSQLDTISLMEKQLQEFSIIQEASASLQSKVEDLSTRNERLEKELEETRNQLETYRDLLFLEGLIDEKNEFIKKKQTNDDLEKKIEELKSKLAEYEEGSQSIQQLQQKAAQAEKREEELKKRMLDLTTHLKEESRRMNEERKRAIERDQERFEALTAKLEELEQQLSAQEVQQQEKENIPEQPEELQPNEDARCEVEVEASLEKGQNDGKKLDVAKETKKVDGSEKSVNEMCQEVAGIFNNNPNNEQWRNAMNIIHRMFSKREELPADKMIDCGLVPFLVEGLNIDDEEVQYHSAAAIAKIVENREEEEDSKVVESGAVAPLIALITSTNFELAEMATKAVSEIAGESAQLRDFVIKSKGVEVLTKMCVKLEDLPMSLVRAIAEAFRIMCCHTDSQVSLEVLDVIVQSLFRLLQFEDHEVCKSVLFALADITYGSSNDFSQEMLVRDSGILPLVFKHLKDDGDDLVVNALGVLINIAGGDDSLKQSVIDLDTLSVLPEIMEKKAKNSKIITRCCRLIRNLMAGNGDQLQAFIDKGFLSMIVQTLKTGDSDCQMHCSWALVNMKGTKERILSLIDEKPMRFRPFASLLTHTDDKCFGNVLDVIHELLSTVSSSQLDTLKEQAKVAGVLENLEKLTKHRNEKVRSLANKILSEYFAEKYGKEANENLKEKEDEEETKMVQKGEMVSDDANSNGVKKGKSDEKKKD